MWSKPPPWRSTIADLPLKRYNTLMPVKTARVSHSRAPKHKHTKHYLQTYWPYLPMLLIVAVGLMLGSPHQRLHGSKQGVLAYATDMSINGLLSATNGQRAANGVGALTLNSQLDSAAQAKANDMVSRDYWSHNTPDGQTPWVFIQGAGYKYTKAGENLAYGFGTSTDTVTGWMNSPAHKANLLDNAFSEVGFGIANGSNYNQSGQETVVVAMYGEPQVLGSNSGSSKPASPKLSLTPTAAAAPAPAPVVAPKLAGSTPVNTMKPVIEPTSKTVTKAQTITKGQTPWIVTAIAFVTAISMLVLMVRHSLRYKRLMRQSEKFVAAHPLFDTALVALIMLGYVLTASSGFIR